jgi:hypothetical protein
MLNGDVTMKIETVENRKGRNPDRSRSRNGEGRSRHQDEEEIILSNGDKIWYHTSYHFPDGHLRAMTDGQRERMRSERAAYRESQGRPARQTTQTTQHRRWIGSE